MFGIQWSGRSDRNSVHPMADAANAARLVSELPTDSPGSAVAEAAAWLESIEAEDFTPHHRLNLISMIDEAVNASFEELTLGYIGAAPGNPGQASDWRLLMDYLDRVTAAYAGVTEACANRRNAELAPRLPLVVVRTLRAITRSMKIGWLRYLPPDRASWEALVRCFRMARGCGAARKFATAYAQESEPTCPQYELTVGIMLAAAAPQNLTPRQVEVAYRITAAHRSLFTVTEERDEQLRRYVFDLDNQGPPARIPEQVESGGDLLFFSAEAVLPQLQPLIDRSRSGLAVMADAHFGSEFGTNEKHGALEHVLRFWDDNPPSRRDQRTRINTTIHVEIGGAAIQRALEGAAQPEKLESGRPMLEIAGEKSAAAAQSAVTALNTWTLTDFSTRGIGARSTRRPDRWLKVGSLLGFRLERSDKWCIAIVRRLRTDARNQTDIGCEILAKSALLVRLEGLASAGTLVEVGGSGPLVRTTAVMLREDPQLHTRASLLFEPGTNAPGQSFTMCCEDTVRRVRLHSVAESLDGWDRVEFDVLD